jgi:hypothetical protein
MAITEISVEFYWITLNYLFGLNGFEPHNKFHHGGS